MNLIDLIIIFVLLLYALEGASSGFIDSLLDFISFLISFIFGLTFYGFFGKLVSQIFTIPIGFANAFGFFISSFLAQAFSSFILKRFVAKAISKVLEKSELNKVLDHVLGALISFISGLILLSFILTMVISLPVSPLVKKLVSQSKIAKILTANTQGLAGIINGVFGQALNETLSFLTVDPKGNESVLLNFSTNNFIVDTKSELEMWQMINTERISRGIKPLDKGSLALVAVARTHCKDMFIRGYFSHNTPEGLTPFDRMVNGGIAFIAAGENLALAPNLELSMKGLMQSKGHRENILSTDFGRVGIGVIDGGIYGEMFCQEFTN